MPQHDDAIHHELQEAVALVLVVSDLLRDDAGQPCFGEPVADAVDLAPLRGRIVEQAEQHVDPVEDDALGIHRLRLGPEQGEHADQVEVAGLDDLGSQPRIEEEQLLLFERWQIPTERGRVGDDLPRALLERDEHARFLHLVRPVDQRLQREHGLAAARSAHDQGRATARQAASGDLVESLDAGGRFRHRGLPRIDLHFEIPCLPVNGMTNDNREVAG